MASDEAGGWRYKHRAAPQGPTSHDVAGKSRNCTCRDSNLPPTAIREGKAQASAHSGVGKSMTLISICGNQRKSQMGPAEEALQEEKERKRQRPPLLAITLVRKVMDVSSISVEELSRRIYAGVLMNDNKLKFWLDLECGKNCFLLLAKSIHGIDENGGNWTWIDEKEKCYEGEVSVQVAEMASVRWPELSATFKTIVLSPKTPYIVDFVVKLRKDSGRSHGRLNLSLILPDGTRLGRTEDLQRRQEGIWIHILVGNFVTTPKNVGEITTNCTLSDGWTNELIVKGIVLRPQSIEVTFD